MSRRRRKQQEQPEDTGRWLISYADFITLLFAFFVVMYSISSVNVGKYRVLSKSIDNAFDSMRSRNPELMEDGSHPESDFPIQINEQPTSIVEPIKLTHFITAEEKRDVEVSEKIIAERRKLDKIAQQFESALGIFIDDKLVSVKKNDLWIEIDIKSKLLFFSGEAALQAKATPVLKKISEVLRKNTNIIHVEGHTDNIPIETIEFPSNWDLSAARAVSVVRELIYDGIKPARLAAVGYGDNHPIADNRLESGRFKNRRVTLVVISQSLARYGVKDNEPLKLMAE